MTTITTRSGKGSPLTNNEVDANFTNLNDDKIEASGDSMTGNLSFGDNNKAIFGAGSDLNIYHNPSVGSIIEDTGAGALFLRGSNSVQIETTAGVDMLLASEGGAVTAYHNGSAKLATTSTGIDVTGTVTADGLTVDGDPALNGNVTITNTGTGSAAGPYLTLDRNSSSPADSDLLGILSFRGRDDGANATDYGTIAGKIADVTGGTEDGVMLFNVISGGSSRDVLTLSHNESVFNNGSADQDFRVESNALTHALFVDAGNNTVNIGRSSGPAALNVQSDSGADGISVYGRSSDEISQVTMYNSGGTGLSQLQTRPQYFDIRSLADVPVIISPNASGKFYVYSGETVVNENSADHDFRVESDNNTHALFVDAGTSRIGVNEDNPQSSLHITETSSTTFDATSTGGQDQNGATLAIQNLSDTNNTFSQILFRNRNSSKAVARIASLTDGTGTDMAFVVESGGSPYEVLRIFREGDMKLQGSASPSFNFLPTGAVGNADISFDGTTFALVSNSSSADMVLSTSSTERVRLNPNSDGIVFNENNNDYDFRIESDSNTHMLFVNAGTNRVGVNNSDPQHKLDVGDTSSAIASAIRLRNSNTTSGSGVALQFSNTAFSGDNEGEIRYVNDGVNNTNYMSFNTEINGVNGMVEMGRFSSTGQFIYQRGAVINESGGDHDFRVESADCENMLTVDAGTNQVLITGDAGTTGTALRVRNNFNNVAKILQDATSLSNNTFTFEIDSSAQISNLTSAGAMKVDTFYGNAFEINGMGTTIINEVGAASGDFRVESDNNNNMLFVDAGNDRVGVGGTPTARMQVTSDGTDAAGAELLLQHANNNTNDVIATVNFANNVGSAARIRASTTGANNTGLIQFFADNAGTDTQVASFKAEEIVFNETSANMDFRVESDSNANALVVDAGSSTVGINTSAGNNGLTVTGGGTMTAGWNKSLMMTANFPVLTWNSVAGSGGYSGIGYDASSSNHSWNFWHRGTSEDLSGTAVLAFAIKSGEIVVNESSSDTDFRVESNNNANMLYVDGANDRVAIGTNTQSAVLTIEGAGNNYSTGAIALKGAGVSDTSFITSANGTFFISQAGTSDDFVINSSELIINDGGVDRDFRVESDNNTTALYVDAGNDRTMFGRVDVSSGEDFCAIDAKPGTSGHVIRTGRDDNSTKNHIVFINPNGTVGSIQTAASATLFNTSSDARLKENIADAEDAGELIDAIQVRQFDWIEDGEHQRYGMVAQELNTVAPEAVSEGETEDDMMAVDYSKLVPMLVKEIQSLRARVAQLESN